MSPGTQVALLLLLSVCAGCSSAKRSASHFDVRLRPGEFLLEEYIRRACETLSPLKATLEGDSPQLISVARDATGISFTPIRNFHEGDNPYRPQQDDHLRQLPEDGSGDLGLLLLKNSPEAFSLRHGSTVLDFRYVGDAERWISNAVLAGTYRDSSGHPFVFQTDGKAAFPGQVPFQYALSIDHIGNPYDYIHSRDTKKSWAVSISARHLELRDIDDDEVVSPTPRWVLNRITQPDCK